MCVCTYKWGKLLIYHSQKNFVQEHTTDVNVQVVAETIQTKSKKMIIKRLASAPFHLHAGLVQINTKRRLQNKGGPVGSWSPCNTKSASLPQPSMIMCFLESVCRRGSADWSPLISSCQDDQLVSTSGTCIISYHSYQTIRNLLAFLGSPFH